MEEVYKKAGSHILMSVLMSHMMVTKNPKIILKNCDTLFTQPQLT